MDQKAIEQAYVAANLAEELGYHKTSESLRKLARAIQLLGPPHPNSNLAALGKPNPANVGSAPQDPRRQTH